VSVRTQILLVVLHDDKPPVADQSTPAIDNPTTLGTMNRIAVTTGNLHTITQRVTDLETRHYLAVNRPTPSQSAWSGICVRGRFTLAGWLACWFRVDRGPFGHGRRMRFSRRLWWHPGCCRGHPRHRSRWRWSQAQCLALVDTIGGAQIVPCRDRAIIDPALPGDAMQGITTLDTVLCSTDRDANRTRLSPCSSARLDRGLPA